jgi:hypothetical protein
VSGACRSPRVVLLAGHRSAEARRRTI